MTQGAPTTAGQDGSASILVVDDHEEIVQLLAMLLATRGHRVVGAHSVAEALDRCAAATPLLIITDVGLVDGNGVELIARLGHPTDRVLFTSGHSRDTFDGTASAIPRDAAFLQKPCSPAALLDTVHDLLAAAT